MIGRFFIWCSGANRELLEQCPTDRNKYIGLGGAVLTTAALAIISFLFASRSILGAPWAVATTGGLLWGLAIFNLDRWLVSAIRRRPTFLGNLAGFLPRLLLAIVLGMVVSEPLVLRIFEPEIVAEMARSTSETNAANAERLANDPRFANLPQMRRRADELQAVADGSAPIGNVLQDPEVVALTQQLADKEAELATAEQAVICEVEGHCGSGVVGVGPAAREKVDVRDRVRAERDALAFALEVKRQEVSGRLNEAADNAQASAATELAELRGEISRRARAHDAEETQLAASTTAATGLLGRMEALHRLGESSGTLAAAQWLLRTFIVLIDALPVLVKFLMTLLPPSLYERHLERTEEELDDRQAQEVADHTELIRLRAEVPLREARAQQQLELELAEVTAAQMVAAQSRLYAELVAHWEANQLAAIKADPDAFVVP